MIHPSVDTPAPVRDPDRLAAFIGESRWGRVLGPIELRRVLESATARTVPAGGYVAHMGEPPTHWLGLMNGVLKMSVTSADGRVSTLSGLATPGWFGEGSLIKHEPRRYDIVALRECRIALVPATAFEWMRQNSLPFNHALQHLMNARLAQFIGMLEHGRLLGPDARVARCLASLFDPEQEPAQRLALDVRQAEVALLCGLSRQRVNRALQRLRDDGLLELEPRGMTVLSLDGLRAWVGQAGR